MVMGTVQMKIIGTLNRCESLKSSKRFILYKKLYSPLRHGSESEQALKTFCS